MAAARVLAFLLRSTIFTILLRPSQELPSHENEIPSTMASENSRLAEQVKAIASKVSRLNALFGSSSSGPVLNGPGYTLQSTPTVVPGAGQSLVSADTIKVLGAKKALQAEHERQAGQQLEEKRPYTLPPMGKRRRKEIGLLHSIIQFEHEENLRTSAPSKSPEYTMYSNKKNKLVLWTAPKPLRPLANVTLAPPVQQHHTTAVAKPTAVPNQALEHPLTPLPSTTPTATPTTPISTYSPQTKIVLSNLRRSVVHHGYTDFSFSPVSRREMHELDRVLRGVEQPSAAVSDLESSEGHSIFATTPNLQRHVVLSAVTNIRKMDTERNHVLKEMEDGHISHSRGQRWLSRILGKMAHIKTSWDWRE